MKGRREHLAPLPKRCMQILKETRSQHPDSALLFLGSRGSEELSDMTLTKVLRDQGFADRATAHGFRSHSDLGYRVAKVREVVAEALAHAMRDKTEAAYRRAAYLGERRDLMRPLGGLLLQVISQARFFAVS
jgi:integrase